MVIGFKEQFKQPILLGNKDHTIRSDTKGRWKPGMKMHMATGVRTKHYKQFALKECVSVQSILILWVNDWFDVFVDGRPLLTYEVAELARRDGFSGIEAFLKWPAFSEDFKGKIIHWTNFSY